jgi:hydrogenase/urease accessory protein HupE
MRRSAGALVLLLVAAGAGAHPLAPCLLELRAGADGRVAVGWKTPLVMPRGAALEPVLPARCRPLDAPVTTAADGGVWTRWTVDCGPDGIVGEEVGIAGPGSIALAAVVRVVLADGRVVQGVVSPARPRLTVPAAPSVAGVLRDYARLGVVHILAGPDHLLFVFGLVLLAGGGRRLLGTVTAFTLGHSVTLSLAALGVVDFPSRVIEMLIAASVLALAVELARRPAVPTAMRRRPWAMAAAFGLLHGLGFASALREAGLPDGEIPLALFSFNLGIELGQLAFVTLVLVARRAAGGWPARLPRWAHDGPVYVMGSLAGYWWLERALALVSGR